MISAVIAGVHCKLPSASSSPLLLESKKTQARRRRGGPPAILPRPRTLQPRATFKATLAQASAVEPPTNRRGFILLFQSVLPFSLTLAKLRFHEAYVIPVHAWVKQ
jgi:hypothetical protein